MSTKDDGGQAFPRDHWHDGHNGMSLRDYFAAKAMQGLLAGQYSESSQANLSEMPDEAYKIADAMMQARTS